MPLCEDFDARPEHAGFDVWDAGFLAVLTATLQLALTLGAQVFSWRGLAFLMAMNAASLALGRALLAGDVPAFRIFAEYVLGLCVFSLIVLAVCIGATTGAAIGAVAAAVAGLVAAAFCIRRRAAPRDGALAVGLAALVCASSFIWSWQAIIAVPHLRAGPFTAWTDYFIHAGEIVQFAHFGALRGTSIFAAGARLPLYHYGSYMIPASLTALSGMPALVSATVLWTLLGFVAMGLAAAALGAMLAGEAGGVLAVAAVLLLPDAAHYGLENPFFDFHWLLQVSASGCYGLALACLAVAAMLRWLRGSGAVHLAWAAGLTIAVFEFRVHIFAVLALTNGILVAAGWRPARRWVKPVAILAGFAGLGIASGVTELVPRAPHFWSGPHHPVQTLLAMLGMRPSPYADAYWTLVAAVHENGGVAGALWRGLAMGAGLVMLPFAAFGALVPVYAAGLFFAARRGARVEDVVPLAAILAYLAMVAGFADTPDEPYEFAHRPFVFVYALLAVWCARDAVVWVGKAGRLAPMLAAAALLIVPVALQGRAQRSMLAWGAKYSVTDVPPGLQAAAGFLRGHARPGDVVAMPLGPLDDAFLALSERPAENPGTPFLVLQSGISTDDAAARRRVVARAMAGEAVPGVAWVVTGPGGAGGGYAVRRVGG